MDYRRQIGRIGEAKMSAVTFQPEPLTPCERAVLTTFFCKLVTDGKTEFTSDDLRLYGLDKHLYGDPSHAIGLLFAKAKHYKLVEDTGRRKRSEILTNHSRENKVYRRL